MSKRLVLEQWIEGHSELKIERKKVFCQACIKTIQCVKKYDVIQHLKTNLHQERLKKFKNESLKQQTIGTSIATTSGFNEQRNFNLDLCRDMVSSNIPLNKLKSHSLRAFLEKYYKTHIPEGSTLRKKYITPIYQEIILNIKGIIGNNYIWFTVDETTDSCGRSVANLIIGVLNSETPTKGFLICSKELSKTNNVTIARFVSEGMAHFFIPEAVPNEKILLMVSDAAAYMVKAAYTLKIFYGQLTHCTCLAHGLNRIAETIRMQFPLVNKLIISGKKIFLKAPLRIQMFRERLPNTPLPPEPILTRWGTWLDAAIYYADNFEQFKQLVLELSTTTSKAIEDCQNVLRQEELRNNLSYVKTNFSFVSKTIKSLEKQQVPLIESIEIINSFKNEVRAAPGPIGELIKTKMENVFAKNEGYQLLNKVACILNGKTVTDLNMAPDILAAFKYAPITSVDVERSFSAYKNILSDRRHNLTMEHLEQYLVISSFQGE